MSMNPSDKFNKVTDAVYWWMVGLICGMLFMAVVCMFGGSMTLRVQLVEPIPAVEAGK